MRVAVVIAARDVASFLGTAISSVLEQSRADLSLTVVDDGSVDDTAAIIGGFADDRLTLVRETGRGLSAARNRGAAEAGAFDAILFLDGDDWLAASALRVLTAALQGDPGAVAVHAPFAYVAESACPDDPGPLDRRTPPRQADLLPRLLLGNVFANGGHVLIRAEAWSKAGSFREDVRFCEDWEFWPRLLMQGRVLGVGGAPQLFVRRRAGSLMHSKAIRHESYRPALAAIAANTALASHLGEARFRRLLRRAETELDWTIGREMFRRGDPVGARPLLWRGLWGRPRPQRLALLALALTRRAPPETADAARN
jgi:glycosyltransferase involved in cell wall biosynthesis